MEELGRVVAVRDGRAEVEIVPGDACKTCGAAGFCSWTGKRMRLVTARYEAGVKVGDVVSVATPEAGRYRAAVQVFGIPAAAMVVGAVAGGLAGGDTWAVVGAGIGLAAALLLGKVIDRSYRRTGRNLPVVTGIVEACGDDGQDRSAEDHSDTESNGGWSGY